jgi:hypothetical protein
MSRKNVGLPHWGSKGILPLAEIAAMPAAEETHCVSAGLCAINIDGRAIRGGYITPTNTGGVGAPENPGQSGYNQPAFGTPSACVAFPLFFAGNKQYSQIGGIQVKTNRLPLLMGPTLL